MSMSVAAGDDGTADDEQSVGVAEIIARYPHGADLQISAFYAAAQHYRRASGEKT